MKRFISVRRKSSNNKCFKITIFIIASIIVLNVLVSLYIKDNNNFKELIFSNSYGINNNFYKENFLYKSSFGLSFKDEMITDDRVLKEVDGEPLIYIYNTFQTDKYKSDYANSYNINPVITQASLILKDYLKKEGISSLVEKESVVKILQENDTPYTKSYRGSRILLEEAYKNNPSLEYFIDMQMSSNKRDTIILDNLAYAKILFVIGTEFDSYEKNKELALSLNKIMETDYQGLSLGIEYRGGDGYHGVYNEDFNENVILIEVGSKFNKLEEVNRSLKVLAKVLGKYMREEK